MKRCVEWLTVGIGGIAFSMLAAEGAVLKSPLQEARSKMEKWVETRQQIAKAKSEWRQERETLKQTIAMYENELKRLNQQIEEAESKKSQASNEFDKLTQKQGSLEAGSEEMAALASKTESRIKAMTERLPGVLVDRIQPAIKRFPQNAEESQMSVSQRLQNVIGVINEIEKFNEGVTVSKEVRKNPSGAQVQVKTLYLGVGQAYFVDEKGDFAGVGRPAQGEWQWVEESQLAPKISKAIAIYEGNAQADYIGLPVSLK